MTRPVRDCVEHEPPGFVMGLSIQSLLCHHVCSSGSRRAGLQQRRGALGFASLQLVARVGGGALKLQFLHACGAGRSV